MAKLELPAEARAMVSERRLWEDLEALVGWERYTGTKGEEEAAHYLKGRLEAEGIEVTLHAFEAYISFPGAAEIEVLGPEKMRIPCTTHCFGASTGSAGVEGDAVLVDEEGRSTEPIAGKVVLAEGLVSPRRFFSLERRGALAQVFANKTDVVHELTVNTIWGTPTPETAGRLPQTPVASLSRTAAAPLVEALRGGKCLRLRLRTEVDTRWRPVVMPEAVIGADGANGEFILAGGHLDSWYAGAMDNAGGDVVLMELARIFRRLQPKIRRGLRVVFFVGHSHGRFAGSTWYADRFWSSLRDGCVGYLNIDQPAFRHGRVFRPFSTVDIAGWVCEMVRREGGQEVTSKAPRRNADQSFAGLGVPSFSFHPVLIPDSPDPPAASAGLGLPWYWHHPEDTLDKVDREVLFEHTRFYAASLADLLARPIVPLDPAALGEAIGTEIETIAREAGDAFDFAPAQKALAGFAERARLLGQRLREVVPAEAGKANRALLRISQRLNPVYYTLTGPYGHDPAMASAGQLPGLQPVRELFSAPDADTRGFLFTQLVRERNRLVDALDSACEEVERALALL